MYKALELIGQASKKKKKYKRHCMFHNRNFDTLHVLRLSIVKFCACFDMSGKHYYYYYYYHELAAAAAAFHHNLQHICGSIERYVIVFLFFFQHRFPLREILWGIVNEINLNFHIMFFNYSFELYFAREYRYYRVEPSTESTALLEC